MMTKKQAEQFKSLYERGQQYGLKPHLHPDVLWFMKLSPEERSHDIRMAAYYDRQCGTRIKATLERLQQMGLMDQNFNFTPVGLEYLDLLNERG